MAPVRRSRALAFVALALFALPVAAQQADTVPHTGIQAFGDDESTGSEDIPAGPETDLNAVDRAHAAYLSDSSLQLVRPELDVDVQPPPPPPGWLRAIGAFLQSLGPIFQVVFWIAVALVVGGLLYFLFGEALRLRFGDKPQRKDKREDDHLTDLRPDAAAARSLLEEADALAQQGRFAEAVHLLLFRSIEDIQERVEGGVPTSLTAREIASLGKLPERARRALKPIIQVVERSFFGGRVVDKDGWQEARSSYEDFAFGEGWA
ncbi:MAG: hypothetical protein RLO80_05720 [Hyphomonas sp.]